LLLPGRANLRSDRRDIQAKTGQSTSRIIFLSAIFIAMLSTAWLAGRDIPAPDPDRYRGMVRLAPDQEGRCQQFELDNKTGLIQPKGTTPCGYDDITSAVPAPSGAGSMGRLNGIVDHFKSQ
jgi:hypothetical protein